MALVVTGERNQCRWSVGRIRIQLENPTKAGSRFVWATNHPVCLTCHVLDLGPFWVGPEGAFNILLCGFKILSKTVRPRDVYHQIRVAWVTAQCFLVHCDGSIKLLSLPSVLGGHDHGF